MKSAQAAETAARNAHGANGSAALAAIQNSTGSEPGAVVIVGVRAMIRAGGRDLLTAFGIFVPVVQTVLLVGVKVALLFFAAPGNRKGSDQNKGNL